MQNSTNNFNVSVRRSGGDQRVREHRRAHGWERVREVREGGGRRKGLQ